MSAFDSFAVVRVPFPFTDRLAQKRRPALVLSQPAFRRANPPGPWIGRLRIYRLRACPNPVWCVNKRKDFWFNDMDTNPSDPLLRRSGNGDNSISWSDSHISGL